MSVLLLHFQAKVSLRDFKILTFVQFSNHVSSYISIHLFAKKKNKNKNKTFLNKAVNMFISARKLIFNREKLNLLRFASSLPTAHHPIWWSI